MTASRRQATFRYQLQGEDGMKVPVCKSMFSSTLGVSNRTVAHWLSDPSINAGGTPSGPEKQESKAPKQGKQKLIVLIIALLELHTKLGKVTQIP